MKNTNKLTRKMLKRYQEIADQLKALNAEKAAIVEVMKMHASTHGPELEFSDIKVTLNWVESTRFNTKEFQAQYAELYAQFKTLEVQTFKPMLKPNNKTNKAA